MNKPRRGEIVLCKITNIQPFSAYCDILDYPGLKGFIHVSQVSDKWVKDIKKHLTVGDEVVMRVFREDRRGFELSIKVVSGGEKTKKLKQGQDEKKARQIMAAVSKKINKNSDQIMPQIINAYGSLRLFIESLRQEREEVFNEINVADEWKKPLLDYTKTEKKELTLSKVVKAFSLDGQGVEVIKKELAHKDFKITYISAPKYGVKLKGYNYKKMEKDFQEWVNLVSKKKGIVFQEVKA